VVRNDGIKLNLRPIQELVHTMKQMPIANKSVFVPLAYSPTSTASPLPSPLREVVVTDAFMQSTNYMKNYTRAVAPRIPLLSRDKCAHGP